MTEQSEEGILEMVADIEEKWVCPNCGAKMERSKSSPEPIYVCPKCGCSVEGTEQSLDAGIVCPNCNQLMEDGNECPHCGYDLGSDFD